MSTVAATNIDAERAAVVALQAPAGGSTDCHAVAATVNASAGRASAVSAVTASSTAPAVVAYGPGTILDCRKLNGDSVLSVGQSGLGAITAGAVTATTIAGTGDLTVTSGDLIANTAGKGLKVKEGSNARMGTLTLTGATPVVTATTAVTATSRIFLTTQSANGGTPTFCYVSTRAAGTSFTVQGVALDTSIVAWLIVEPA